jgi:hypothetical protein
MAKTDYLLVGKTGAISYSSNGGGSYTRVSTGLTAGTTYRILADDGFEDNNTIYVGGNNAAAGNVMRYVIGESANFETLGNPTAAAIVDLQMADGVIYAQSAAAVDRNLNPRIAAGTVAVIWDTMAIGLPGGVALNTLAVGMGGSNVVYAGDTTALILYAFDDIFTSKPVITNPGDGASVGIDPVTAVPTR